MGGEKEIHKKITSFRLGSPPRGRGKVPTGLVRSGAQRITPAWAGKRLSLDAGADTGRDHPRVGGEKTLPSAPAGVALGSPPRGRGKAAAECSSTGASRITPAWAGKRK